MGWWQTADKASLEVFDRREQDDLATVVIAKHINPAVEIGGDARLLLPEQKRIKSNQETIDGQVRNARHATAILRQAAAVCARSCAQVIDEATSRPFCQTSCPAATVCI